MLTCSLSFTAFNSFAQNSDEYLRSIPPHSIVEGSAQHSGIQPDYFLDTDASEFEPLLKIADQIGQSSQSIPDKVASVIIEVRKIFRHHQYHDPVYLNLAEHYRARGAMIPLSQYISCGAGVCRENALLMHILLTRAGIANSHVYAKVAVDYGAGPVKPEDHGFVVFEYQGERWIADSYYKQFNGYSFDELLNDHETLKQPTRMLSFAVPRSEPRAIVQLNSFPKYAPPSQKSCSSLFAAF